MYFSKNFLTSSSFLLSYNFIFISFSLNLPLFSWINLLIFLAGPNLIFNDKRSFFVNKVNISPDIYSFIKIFLISSLRLNLLLIYSATSSFVEFSVKLKL